MDNSDACRYIVATQFSKYPGGRFKSDGRFSGEEFREEVLMPMLARCQQITMVLTGANGYGASFLDESFGEIGKRLGEQECRKRIILVSDDDPTLEAIIWRKLARVL